ncbi:MAG: hypothetical protein KC619_35895 [Myxococcales bacterium]|nr:hypothetical protein [Myxococcales bacterium]
MSLVTVEVPNRAAAVALAKAIAAQSRHARDGVGLPRCEHPRWRLKGGTLARLRRAVASGKRGLVSACPCAARDEPSPNCLHVTWQAASVLELPDGTVLVQAEAEALEGRAEPRRALSDDEQELVEETWTLRAERRAEAHG